jgi:hypothetical protein
MMKLIVLITLNAPAKAGGFYQLIENNTEAGALTDIQNE